MNNFKELKVWQKTISFVTDIYKTTATFPKFEIYGISSQIQRASVSISCNISEGCGKTSKKDFKRFLEIAYSSAFEVENLLIICNNLEYTTEEKNSSLITNIKEIQKMLAGLKASIKI